VARFYVEKRKDGKMQEKTKKNNISQQEKTQQPNFIQKHGKTTYDVFIHFSPTSKETFSDKVVRLIKNDSKVNEIS